MHYKIVFRQRARQDLKSTLEFIKKDNPKAALDWVEYLESSALSLADNPHRVALYRNSEKLRQLSLKRGYGVLFWISESNQTVYISRVFGKGQLRRS